MEAMEQKILEEVETLKKAIFRRERTVLIALSAERITRIIEEYGVWLSMDSVRRAWNTVTSIKDEVPDTFVRLKQAVRTLPTLRGVALEETHTISAAEMSEPETVSEASGEAPMWSSSEKDEDVEGAMEITDKEVDRTSETLLEEKLHVPTPEDVRDFFREEVSYPSEEEGDTDRLGRDSETRMKEKQSRPMTERTQMRPRTLSQVPSEGTTAQERMRLTPSILRYKIGLDDIQRRMHVKILHEDKLRLERILREKLQEPDLLQLLRSGGPERNAYFLLPRLSRFSVNGKVMFCTIENLIALFPDQFSDIAYIEQYRDALCFVKDTPKLTWTITRGEVLEETTNRAYEEEETALREYALGHHISGTKTGILRRTLVEAIFDILVMQMTVKDKILSTSIERTSTSLAVGNHFCVNYGSEGIRLGEAETSFKHRALGVCPSW